MVTIVFHCNSIPCKGVLCLEKVERIIIHRKWDKRNW